MNALPLAITMGDPAGIGPEIIAKAFERDPDALAGCFVAGDVGCLRRGAAWAAAGGLPLPVAVLGSVAELPAVPPRCIPVLQVGPAPAPLPPVG